MKPRLLILSAPLLLLAACQTIPDAKIIPPPGNAVSELLLQPEWQAVATEHPKFAAYLTREFFRTDYEMAVTKARMFEAIKERRRRFDQSKPIPASPFPPTPK